MDEETELVLLPDTGSYDSDLTRQNNKTGTHTMNTSLRAPTINSINEVAHCLINGIEDRATIVGAMNQALARVGFCVDITLIDDNEYYASVKSVMTALYEIDELGFVAASKGLRAGSSWRFKLYIYPAGVVDSLGPYNNTRKASLVAEVPYRLSRHKRCMKNLAKALARARDELHHRVVETEQVCH